MYFRDVVRRILKLQNYERVRRLLLVLVLYLNRSTIRQHLNIPTVFQNQDKEWLSLCFARRGDDRVKERRDCWYYYYTSTVFFGCNQLSLLASQLGADLELHIPTNTGERIKRRGEASGEVLAKQAWCRVVCGAVNSSVSELMTCRHWQSNAADLVLGL